MNGLGKRVQVLEARTPVGCMTCRWWHGTIVEDRFQGRSRPDQCPQCGRVVPPQLVIRLERVHWDDM